MLNKKNLKHSINFGGSQVAQLLITFLSFIFIARILGEEDFGKFSSAFNYALVITTITRFGFTLFIPREVSRDEDHAPFLFYKTLYLQTILSVISLGFLYLAAPFFGVVDDIFTASFLLWGYFLFFNIHNVWMTYLIGLGRVNEASLTVFYGKLFEGLLIFGVYFWSPTLIGFCWAFLVGNCIRIGSAGYYAGKYTDLAFRRVKWRELVAFLKQATPFGLTVSFISLKERSDILVLTRLTEPAAVGIYSAASRLIEAAGVVSRTLLTVAYPLLSKAYVESMDKLRTGVLQYSNTLLFVSLPFSVFVWLAAQKIVLLFYGNQFDQSGDVLMVLGPLIVIRFYNYLLRTVLNAIDQQNTVAKLDFAAVFISFGLQVYFILTYGIIGAAIAKILSDLFTFVVMLIPVTRRVTFPFDVKFVLLSGVATIGGGVAFMLTDHLHVIASGCVALAIYVGLQYQFGFHKKIMTT